MDILILKNTAQTVAIALDTKGPEIRTGKMKSAEGALFTAGKKITLKFDQQVVVQHI